MCAVVIGYSYRREHLPIACQQCIRRESVATLRGNPYKSEAASPPTTLDATKQQVREAEMQGMVKPLVVGHKTPFACALNLLHTNQGGRQKINSIQYVVSSDSSE